MQCADTALLIKMRSYSELSQLRDIQSRFDYLKLNGEVGIGTFGFNRYLNQKFYNSLEWKRVRDIVILRDNACELGLDGYQIEGKIYIHHMNPIEITDLDLITDFLLNPDYLISVSLDMHNAIHYGNSDILKKYELHNRMPNDTCPWKVQKGGIVHE